MRICLYDAYERGGVMDTSTCTLHMTEKTKRGPVRSPRDTPTLNSPRESSGLNSCQQTPRTHRGPEGGVIRG